MKATLVLLLFLGLFSPPSSAAKVGGQGGGGRRRGSSGKPPGASSIGQLVDRLRRERSTIGEIIEMSRQLQMEREMQSVAAARRAWQQAPPRMVVVANRLPLSVKRGADGQLEYSVSGGGMVSALLGVQNVRMVWVGWCPVPDDITEIELEQVRRALLSRGCVPVFLPSELASAYYNGFCNDVLWPLFHYVISRTPEGEEGAAEREQENWQAYKRVNERFAEVVGSVARESDLVWVHDYHLMLLPSLLRAQHEHIKIGWFLHTPWPSSEVFRTLPMRRELLVGLLGADLLGFHVYEYARHFLHSCTRLLGSEVSFHNRRLRWERSLPADAGGGVLSHSVKVDAFPIGIDPPRFQAALKTDKVRERIEQLQQQFKGQGALPVRPRPASPGPAPQRPASPAPASQRPASHGPASQRPRRNPLTTASGTPPPRSAASRHRPYGLHQRDPAQAARHGGVAAGASRVRGQGRAAPDRRPHTHRGR